MSIKMHEIDEIFQNCKIGVIPNGDHIITAISLSSMVRILVASAGYSHSQAAAFLAATFFHPPSTITESTEFVIVDDLGDNWPKGLPG